MYKMKAIFKENTYEWLPHTWPFFKNILLRLVYMENAKKTSDFLQKNGIIKWDEHYTTTFHKIHPEPYV